MIHNKQRITTTLMALLSLCWLPAAEASESVTIGSAAMDIPVEMIKRFEPLTHYLSITTGIDVTFKPSPNLAAAMEDLGNNQTQISYLTPVAYLEAHEKYQVVPLVAPTTNGKPSFSLVIVARNPGKIKTPGDLKGKRFAFGDEKALLQKAAVASMGLKAEDFSQIAYLKHYDNIAKAIIAGDFDGGILKDSVALEFKNKGIKIIGTTPPLPSYVFAVRKDTPKPVVEKLKAAFLKLKKQGTNAAVLQAFDHTYDGFVTVEDKDYDPVRKLIAPFK